MLQTIRDRSQGWLTGVVVFLVCAAFALWGIHSYVDSGGAQPTMAAKVNGHTVPQATMNVAYERLRQQQQMQLGADFVIDQKVETQLKKRALDQLIMGQILQQAALKEGYRVSLGEVYAALFMAPAFQVNGQFSTDRFKDVLSGMLYTEQTFLADMTTTMLANQVRSGFVESAFCLPAEIDNTIKLVNQKRDFGYLIVPAQRFSDHITITTNDANSYYQQHKTEFVTPEQVSIEYLELSLPQIAAQLHFSDDQLQQFYQNNLSTYTRPQRWHVAHILIKVPDDATPEQVAAAKEKINSIAQQARAGEDFSKLAAEYSDDKISANHGGELDWFSSGMIDPDLEKVVLTLHNPGDISQQVIQTKYGFSVIKLLGIEKPQVLPFTQVHDQVAKALAQAQADKIFADDNDKLSNLTYANPGSLDVAAKALDLQVKTSDYFGAKGGTAAITSNPKVVAAAFATDTLQGNNSAVLDIDPGTAVVIRVKQHKPAMLQPFAAVSADIIQQLKSQDAQQQAQAFGIQLLQELTQGQGKNIQQLAAKAKLPWNSVTAASRFGGKTSATLLAAAFRMPRPSGNNTFTSAGIKLPNGDYAVLMLSAVLDGKIDKIADNQRRIYREELESNFGHMDYALYVRGLVHKAKIVVDKPKIPTPS